MPMLIWLFSNTIQSFDRAELRSRLSRCDYLTGFIHIQLCPEIHFKVFPVSWRILYLTILGTL